MPGEDVIRKAEKDKWEGKSPSTQAAEFVREEIHHIREGKHGARSTNQVIAIGLSKARRAGVQLPLPARAKASRKVREQAKRDNRRGQKFRKGATSRARSRAVLAELRHEGHSGGSHRSLSAHARVVAHRRGKASRYRSAIKAVRTRQKSHR